MSNAVAAIGTLLKVGDGGGPEVFTTVAEVKDITGPSTTVDTIEVTSHDSSGYYKEYIPSLKDGGEVTFSCNFTSSTTQTGLVTDMEARTRRNFQVVTTHSPAKTASFAGYITNMGHSFPVADIATRDVTIKITGPITWS